MKLYLQNINKIEDPELIQIIEAYKEKYILPLNTKDNKLLTITPSINDVDDIDTINALCKMLIDNKVAIVSIILTNLYSDSGVTAPYGTFRMAGDVKILHKNGRALLNIIRDKLIKEGLFKEIETNIDDIIVLGQLNQGLILS